MGKLICTFMVAISLTACAKEKGESIVEPFSCEKYASNFAVQWPGGAIVKSEITECSNGVFTVEADGDSFTTTAPVIQRQNAGLTYELVYFENYY